MRIPNYKKSKQSIEYLLSGVVNTLSEGVKSWWKQLTGSGATQRDKENAEIDLENQSVLMDKQDEINRKWYEDYESMPAQVRQARAAGINPMALFGGSSPSVSASGGVGLGNAGASPIGDSSAGNILGTVLGFLKYRTDKQNIESEISNRNSQTSINRVEAKWRDKILGEQYNSIIADRKKIEAETANVRANLPKILADTEYAQTMALFAPEYFDATIGEARTNALRNVSQVELNDKEKENLDAVIKVHRKEIDEIDAKIALMQSEAILNASKKDLTDQEVAESKKRMEKMDEEIKKIGKEIGLTEKDIQFYIWNHPRQSSAFGLRWNNSSASGTQRNKLSPEITDDELLMYVRERFGYEAAEALQR